VNGNRVLVTLDSGAVEEGVVVAATFGVDATVLVRFADRTETWFAGHRVKAL